MPDTVLRLIYCETCCQNSVKRKVAEKIVPRIRVNRVGFAGREAHVLLGRSVTFLMEAVF
jgi:hypothetical protein